MMILQRSLPGGLLIGAVTFMATIAATQVGLASWMISPITASLAAYAWMQFRQRHQEQRRRPRNEADDGVPGIYAPTATRARPNEDLAPLQTQLTTAETRSRQLTQQLQTAQQELTQQKATVAQLREQLQTRTQRLAELKTEYTQLANQQQDLTTQAATYQAVETALAAIQAEASQLQTKVTELESKVNEYEEYIPLLETDLAQKERQLQDFTRAEQTELAKLAMENARLQRELGQYAAHSQPAGQDELGTAAAAIATVDETRVNPPYRLDVQCFDDLQAVNRKLLKSVLGRIFDLQYTPRPHDCEAVKKYKYKAQKLYRIKAGRYRICYAIEDSPENCVQILMVDNRTEGIYDAELARRLGY